VTRSIKVFYSSDMVSDAGRRMSPSDRKPLEVAAALALRDWPIEIVAPAPTACRPGIQIPARSGPRRVLTIRYRACRPMRLTIAIRRGGRVVARRSRRVAASAGAIAIRGVRPGRVRVSFG